MKLKHLFLLLGVVNALLVGSSNLFAQDSQSVNLAWDASPSPSVTSYVVYHGKASGSYANLTNVGNQTTARINELQAGQIYFFAVTALDDAGVESLPSNEISYLVPVIDPPPTIALAAPANGASYTAPATIRLAASASVTIAGNSVPISLKLTGKSATITWASVAGKSYRVAYKASLSDVNWTVLSGDITATSTSASWSDPEGSRFNQRYYTVYVTN